jgi:hypothetical protein
VVITTGGLPPLALLTIVSALYDCVLDKWLCKKAIFNCEPVPVGISSAFTNANKSLLLKTNSGQDVVWRTAMCEADQLHVAKLMSLEGEHH